MDIRVTEVHIHDRFHVCPDSSCFPKFDVALLSLETRVPLSEYIQPACLPAPGSRVRYEYLVVTGWGNTQRGFGYKEADTLQKLDVTHGESRQDRFKIHLMTCFRAHRELQCGVASHCQ